MAALSLTTFGPFVVQLSWLSTNLYNKFWSQDVQIFLNVQVHFRSVRQIFHFNKTLQLLKFEKKTFGFTLPHPSLMFVGNSDSYPPLDLRPVRGSTEGGLQILDLCGK